MKVQKVFALMILSVVITGCTLRQSVFIRNFLDVPASVVLYYRNNTRILDTLKFTNSIQRIRGSLIDDLALSKSGLMLNDSTINFTILPQSTNLVYGGAPAGFWDLYEIEIEFENTSQTLLKGNENLMKKGRGGFLHMVYYFDLTPSKREVNNH